MSTQSTRYRHRIANQVDRRDQSQNGVKVLVHVDRDGSTFVESSCNCFGVVGRTHSNTDCQLLKKLMKETPL